MRSILLVLLLFSFSECILECIKENSGRCLMKIRGCERSDGPVVAIANIRSLERCLSYAREVKGLAVNYSPPEAAILRKNRDKFRASCEILSCPDIGFANTINDSAYDYYSLYKNLSNESTCIKSIGVFRLFEEKMNYMDAISACQSIGGDLANVISESRTNSLALLLSNRLHDWYKVAYIGLDDRKKEGRFVTSSGNHLSCYKYRAWGPGQPRSRYKNEDCVLLDSTRGWRVVNCKLKFPVLCELYPTVPYCWSKSVEINRNCTL